MQKFRDKKEFFLNILKAIVASNKTRKNSMELLKILLFFDQYNLTTFEFSFKVKNKKILKEIRFLNMDANGYSCRNSKLFLKRVELFEKILREKCKNRKFLGVIKALKKITNTPMDLYFGADIKDRNYLFAFWLIFGGVKRSGKVSFWPYDFDDIIDRSLDSIGLKRAKLLKKEILNLGFDISNNYLRYKVYYLCRERILKDHTFTELMKNINKNLGDFKYFYFFSEMYDENGKLVKEKLFIEFLEDIINEDKKTINSILENILKIKKINFDLEELETTLKKCGGRISLISFEPDGTLTFYIRQK